MQNNLKNAKTTQLTDFSNNSHEAKIYTHKKQKIYTHKNTINANLSIYLFLF